MGCGCACLLALIAASAPRLALLFLWLFTGYVDRAFGSLIVPLLGLIFLPLSTVIYVLVWDPISGVTGFEWFWMLLALLVDLSSYGGSAYGRRRRFSS